MEFKMAKRRMLSQSIISDEHFNAMSEHGQNLFMRLLLISDDCGIVPGNEFTLKTLTASNLIGLHEIIETGLILPLEHDGKQFYAFKRESFENHQSYLIKNRTKSEYLKVDMNEYGEIYKTLQNFTKDSGGIARYPNKRLKIKDKREEIKESEENFVKFWSIYPKRNGKKLGKSEALKKFKVIKEIDQLMIAVENFAKSKKALDGFAEDAKRFLSNDRWRDWIDGAGEVAQTKTEQNNEKVLAAMQEVWDKKMGDKK